MRSRDAARQTARLQAMARLLPFLIFLGVALWLATASQRRMTARRDPRAFRPRARFREWFDRKAPEAAFRVRRRDLAGLRDAYSGAALDPASPLLRCTRCLAYYHADSAAVLGRENGGRCGGCGGADFRAVEVTSD